MVVQEFCMELEELLQLVPEKLRAISDRAATVPAVPGKWSRKQVLGHLLDSAANNHQRFVRLRFGDVALPGYAQSDWVLAQRYQDRAWTELVETWRVLNLHLLRAAEGIPEQALGNRWTRPDAAPVTLGFIVSDYLVHLRHHLEQILS